MLEIAAHCRVGQDPIARQTKTGKDMATASVAVDVTQGEGDQQTLWLGLVAFGKMADTLMRHKQGDLLSLQGKATQSHWTGKDGQEQTRLSVNVESIISARTARPGGRTKAAPTEVTPITHPFNNSINF